MADIVGQFDITILQGATFNPVITWKNKSTGVPVDLTGYSARLQVRKSASDSNKLLDLTSGDGITLGGSAGTITILVSATDTAALPAGAYKYDLELESGAGVVRRLLEGSATISAEVSR